MMTFFGIENILISPAYAQTASGGGMQGIIQFIPFILIFVVFYFLLIRPQQTKAKQMRQRLAALRRGDKVVTAGGIVATIAKVRDDSAEIEIDIAPDVRVVVVRDTIATIVSGSGKLAQEHKTLKKTVPAKGENKPSSTKIDVKSEMSPSKSADSNSGEKIVSKKK